MTAAKGQQYYESQLKKIEFDKVNDVHDNSDGNNIVDPDDDYYYQSLQSTVKIEPIPGTSGKKLPSVVKPQDMQKNRVEVAIDEVKIIRSQDADETNTSEDSNQEKIYDFDENEQDPDDPQELAVQVFETKGIIKSGKKSKANALASFSCVVCSYTANKKFLLSRHLKTHCDERPYKCDVCERGFKTNAALMNHRNIHLGRKPHVCSSCEMAFTTSGELVRHARYRHTHIKPHKCTECDYCSVEMSKLRRHMRCHTGERPYQCPHCTYASPDTFKLKRHLRIHTGEKPYECDICHARFTQSNSLKHHRLIHSVSEKPVFQCHLCPTTCGRKSDLRMHIKNLHSSDNPLPCKRCGKELPDRYSYKMHIKSHEGEKCFRCEYCPYASISQRHLDSHVLIHLDAKPFTCEICKSSFRRKQLLTRHTKIYHSNNYEPPIQRKKDHKCPHCNKMFAFNGNLIRHMEIHDPDLHRVEKIDKLKLGRLKRVKADGSVVTVMPFNKFASLFDENEELFYDETEEEQQIENEPIQEEVFEETEVYNEDNVQYVYDEYEAEEQVEGEHYEAEHEETNAKTLLNVKQDKAPPIDSNETSIKRDMIIKIEDQNGSEIMVLKDQEDEDFMVIEVLSDDEDNDEQQLEELQVQSLENKPITINKNANVSKNKNSNTNTQSLISDYFGFEVNADDDDEETKGAIRILEMIEQE